MASSTEATEWPQSLKSFANRCFAACTDANRSQVQEELRALIYRSYTQGTIETTNWDTMELESLGGKKTKKKRPALSGAHELLSERDKIEKRAKRFDEEKAAYDSEEHGNVYIPGLAGPSSAGISGNPMSTYTPKPLGMYPKGKSGSLKESRKSGTQEQKHYSGAIHNSRRSMFAGEVNGGHSAKMSGNLVGGMSASVFASNDITDPNVIDWDQDTVVGLSTKLEKPYLRLTSAPDPRNVRTLPTLMQTLDLLKKKWRSEGNYNYICDQFKSMRQDLTVQRIKNDFTVKVYEIHARIALEKGDLGEYNQCQSQLRGLYALGIPGSVMEFLAYRILYLLHTRNRRDVNTLMAELTPAHKSQPAVEHALAVRSALATGNYHAFFRLYVNAPNLNAYVMDQFIDRERINALHTMAKCFRPSLSLAFMTTELAFSDVQNTFQFLTRYKADVFVQQNNSSAGSKRKHLPRSALLEKLWDAKAAQGSLDLARSQFRTVDIKGQI